MNGLRAALRRTGDGRKAFDGGEAQPALLGLAGKAAARGQQSLCTQPGQQLLWASEEWVSCLGTPSRADMF